MKILLDENMPRQLMSELTSRGHKVESVHTLHIIGISNGELYRTISQKYDLCLTKDEGFARQYGKTSLQSNVKVIHVALKQQPQSAYVFEFLTHFNQTNWDEYKNGDSWP